MSRERTDSRESTEIRAIIICRGRSDKKAREARLGDGRGTRSRDFGWWGGREKMDRQGREDLPLQTPLFVRTMLHAGYLQDICLFAQESPDHMHPGSILESRIGDDIRGVSLWANDPRTLSSLSSQSRILFRNFDDEEMESRTACNVRGLALSRNPIIFISFGVITWRVGDLINLQTARIAGNND